MGLITQVRVFCQSHLLTPNKEGQGIEIPGWGYSLQGYARSRPDATGLVDLVLATMSSPQEEAEGDVAPSTAAAKGRPAKRPRIYEDHRPMSIIEQGIKAGTIYQVGWIETPPRWGCCCVSLPPFLPSPSPVLSLFLSVCPCICLSAHLGYVCVCVCVCCYVHVRVGGYVSVCIYVCMHACVTAPVRSALHVRAHECMCGPMCVCACFDYLMAGRDALVTPIDEPPEEYGNPTKELQGAQSALEPCLVVQMSTSKSHT
jgi:hypothetical protein